MRGGGGEIEGERGVRGMMTRCIYSKRVKEGGGEGGKEGEREGWTDKKMETLSTPPVTVSGNILSRVYKTKMLLM